jgi:hypothetical protein
MHGSTEIVPIGETNTTAANTEYNQELAIDELSLNAAAFTRDL